MSEHLHRLRVRYAETDQMGVVHHAAYVPWLEEARIAWLRAHGHSYRELEAGGIAMPVVALELRYRRPLRFDDEVTVAVDARAEGPSRIVFPARILRGDELCAEASVMVATVDRTARPVRIPPALAALLGRDG